MIYFCLSVYLSVGPAYKIPKLIHFRVVLFHTPNSGLIDLWALSLKFSLLLFPSDDGSSPLPSLLPPSKIHPGSLPPAVRPFPLSFYFFSFVSSPSVSFIRPSPPAAFGHPSSVRKTPPADSSGGLSTNDLSWIPAPRMWFCSRPVRLMVLGLGVG